MNNNTIKLKSKETFLNNPTISILVDDFPTNQEILESVFPNKEQDQQKHYLEKLPKIYEHPQWKSEIDPIINAIAKHLVLKSPFSKKRKKYVFRYIYSLLRWHSLHQYILALYENKINKIPANYLNYKYPHYLKNIQRNLTPLPRNLLRKWNTRYKGINNWLINIGFMNKPIFKYVPDAHISLYYQINLSINRSKLIDGSIYSGSICGTHEKKSKRKYKDISTVKDLLRYIKGSWYYTSAKLINNGAVNEFFDDYLMYYGKKLLEIIDSKKFGENINNGLGLIVDSIIEVISNKITYRVGIEYLRSYKNIIESLEKQENPWAKLTDTEFFEKFSEMLKKNYERKVRNKVLT